MSQRGVPAVRFPDPEPVLIRLRGIPVSIARRFWKRSVGNCLKTTSERLQSSPVTPLQS